MGEGEWPRESVSVWTTTGSGQAHNKKKKEKKKKRIAAKGPHRKSKSRCRILADAVNNLRSDLQRTAQRR